MVWKNWISAKTNCNLNDLFKELKKIFVLILMEVIECLHKTADDVAAEESLKLDFHSFLLIFP